MKKQEIRQKEREKYDLNYYQKEYWKEDFHNISNNTGFHYDDPKHERRFNFLTEILIKNFNFNSFLDAGCGMGHIIRNLIKIKSKEKVRGIEISKDALKIFMKDLVEKNIILEASLEKLPFKDKEFDLVFCSDVLEHIPKIDVKDAIKELARVTKKYLVLTINLTNRYHYHPSILPRKEWEKLFVKSRELKILRDLQKKIECSTKKIYPEYDFFIFEKL